MISNKDTSMQFDKENIRWLFVKYKDTKSIDVRNELVLLNHGLVYKIIKREFYNAVGEFDDLISIGTIGLIKAVENYDLSRDIEFSTYAGKCIRNEIYMMIRNYKKKSGNNTIVSLYDITSNKDMSEDTTIEDSIKDDRDIIEEYEDYEIKKNNDNIIHKILDTLEEEETDVIKLYYGFYKGIMYDQKYIAKKYNVTQSAISYRIKKILLKIRKIVCEENGCIYFNEDKMINPKMKCIVKKGTK